MSEQPNYYSILPANVRYDERLSASEKLLYSEITALSSKTGECFASNVYFSELYKVSTKSISNWIRNLKECGYITVDYEYNGKEIVKRHIKIDCKTSIPIEENFHTPIEENFHTPIEKKVKDNNTSINNININNNCISKDIPETDVSVNSKKKPTSGIGSNGFRWSF